MDDGVAENFQSINFQGVLSTGRESLCVFEGNNNLAFVGVRKASAGSDVIV